MIIIIGRYLLYLVIITLIVALVIPKYSYQALAAGISAFLAAGLGWIIKDYFYLPRPFIVTGNDPILPYLLDGTFPSNHTAAATAIGVSIFLSNRRLGLLYLFVALLIAAGRIMGGVHTYIDVLFGFALGCVSALIIYRFRH